MSVELESLSLPELEALLAKGQKLAAEKTAAAKFERLRPEAVEAVRNAPPENLPAIIAAAKGGKRKPRGTAAPKEKAQYKWDDSLSKNRKIKPDGSFVEPPYFLRGAKAKIPLR
jgi:hypothetical protein